MLPSFTKTRVANAGTKFSSLSGVAFSSPSAHLDFDPAEQLLHTDELDAPAIQPMPHRRGKLWGVRALRGRSVLGRGRWGVCLL